jgi:4-hydroxy-tetrahydrodipicolinate synthase
MPHESVQLYERVTNGDHAGAMALWQRMIPSLLYIWRGQYIPKVKAAARLRGYDGGSVRAPLQNLSPEAEGEVKACLAPLNRE